MREQCTAPGLVPGRARVKTCRVSPTNRPANTPGTDAQYPAWRRSLDRVEHQLSRALRALSSAAEPQVDLAPGATCIGDALSAVYGACDFRGDPLAKVTQAKSFIDQARENLKLAIEYDPELLPVGTLLQQSREELTGPERQFGTTPPISVRQPRPLVASVDTPSLHYQERGSLKPQIHVPEPPPPPPPELGPLPSPKNVSELGDTIALVKERAQQRRKQRQQHREKRAEQQRQRAEQQHLEQIPEGFAAPLDKALTEEQFVAARARDLFEEITMLGIQRAPLLGDGWRSIKFLDGRMLTSIDAVASLGTGALEAIEKIVVDAPFKDPSRAFGAPMIFGCMEGRDALGAAQRVIYHLDADDLEVSKYAGDALKLIPHPDLGLALRTMLSDPSAAYRALALDVLVYRGMASVQELLNGAADAAPRVAAIALVGLATEHPNHPELQGLLTTAADEPELKPAAWLAMALSRHSETVFHCQRGFDTELQEHAAMTLALVADEALAARLLNRCQSAPDIAVLNALGWIGSPKCVPQLIELLASGDEQLATAAAYALDRITGAGLLEEVQVDPESIMIPDLPEPEVGDPDAKPEPLAKQVSDPRDLPDEASPDTLARPTVDPGRWQRYWRQRQKDYREQARYRRGHPYRPAVSLWELDTAPLTVPDRRFLQRELIIRTGRFVRFDPHDFVGVQIEALKQWQPIANDVGSPGSWSIPSRRD